MAYEQRDNNGALFRNERKERENHPDYTGKAMIEGVEYWVSAWVKETRDGKKYFSMAYKPKDEQGTTARSAPGAQRRGPSNPRDSRWDDGEPPF